MSSSDVSDLASVQLARRLQEEEDQLAAYQLQHHFNTGPRGHHGDVTRGEEDQLAAYQIQHHFNTGPSLARVDTISYNIPPGDDTVQYVVSDGEGSVDTDSEEVRELNYVSDDDNMELEEGSPSVVTSPGGTMVTSPGGTMVMSPGGTMVTSPGTHELVPSALDTAFSTPRHAIVVLDDSEVEDLRPPPVRQTRSRTAQIQSNQQPPPSRPGPASRIPQPVSRQQQSSRPTAQEEDNVILTVGRTTRQPQAESRSSIVITNNSAAPPSANTRSRTRSSQNNGQSSGSNIGNSGSSIVDLAGSSSSSGNSRQRNRANNNNRRGNHHQTRRNSQSNQHSRARSASSIQIITSSTPPTSQGGPQRTPARSSETRPSTSSGRRPVTSHVTSTSSGRRPVTSHITSTVTSHVTSRARMTMGQPHGLINVNRGIIINGIPLRQLGFEYRQNQRSYGTVQNLAAILRDGLNDSMSYEEMIALDESNELQPGQGLSSLEISQNTLTKPFSASSNSASSSGSNSTSCNICLSDFREGEKVRVLPCFHSFHSQCIDNWLQRKPECPVCRSRVNMSRDHSQIT